MVLLLLLLGGGIAAFFFAILALMKNSEVYQEALARVRASQEVRRELGEPIEAGLLVWGEVSTGTHGGKARLYFSVVGPHGEGAVTVNAIKTDTLWTFRRLSVATGENKNSINLVARGDSLE